MLSFMQPADCPVIESLEKHEVIFAADQKQYNPLRTIRGNGEEAQVLSRWTLTEEQRRMIAEGGDVYLELWTFRDLTGTPKALQPIRMAVGKNVDPDYIRQEYQLPE